MLIGNYSAWPILCRTMAPLPLEQEDITPEACAQRITEVVLLLEALQSHQSTVDTIERWIPSVSAILVALLTCGGLCFPVLWMPVLSGIVVTLIVPIWLYVYGSFLDCTVTEGQAEQAHLHQMHDTALSRLHATPPASPTPSTATLCGSIGSDSTWVSDVI